MVHLGTTEAFRFEATSALSKATIIGSLPCVCSQAAGPISGEIDFSAIGPRSNLEDGVGCRSYMEAHKTFHVMRSVQGYLAQNKHSHTSGQQKSID